MSSFGTEMSSRSRTTAKTKKDDLITFWQLYEKAAKTRYGQGILIVKKPDTEKKVNNIDFDLSIVDKEKEPHEKTRTIVDINMKEYTNRGKQSQDETLVKIEKTSSTMKGERYTFSTTKGISFGLGANIGAQVMGAVAGISGQFNKSKSKTEETEQTSEEGFTFSYHQEEKISVPPGMHVEAKITTYRMKYEMGYNLKFSIKKNAVLSVSYKSPWQQCFFGLIRSNGRVSIRDMISGLPNFNGEDEDDTISFTQAGTLSWVGEGCSVDKNEEPLSM